MPLSLHQAIVPAQRQIIAAVAALVAKAEAHCAGDKAAAEALIGARLAPDMLPFGYQVKSVAEHSQGAVEGIRAGVYSPSLDPWPDSFAGLRDKLAAADAFMAALDPAEMESWIGRDMRFEFRDRRMDFTAESFLLGFSQPNFFFHAATAYDVLRAQGLAIGKGDFIGRPPLKG